MYQIQPWRCSLPLANAFFASVCHALSFNLYSAASFSQASISLAMRFSLLCSISVKALCTGLAPGVFPAEGLPISIVQINGGSCQLWLTLTHRQSGSQLPTGGSRLYSQQERATFSSRAHPISPVFAK